MSLPPGRPGTLSFPEPFMNFLKSTVTSARIVTSGVLPFFLRIQSPECSRRAEAVTHSSPGLGQGQTLSRCSLNDSRVEAAVVCCLLGCFETRFHVIQTDH